MEPILLIHGYSSEGKDKSVEEIYGSLPGDLRDLFGEENVKDLNLSRWLSLNDGIMLDDVSFAMDRALKESLPELLESGFHVIIHSTGALVARNWIKKFNQSGGPSPIKNLIHLAGANFGSGLAHIGKGQLARWGRLIFQGTGRGKQILNELEFGSWKTIDLHRHFLQPGMDIYHNYQVQEFCIIGSQTLGFLRPVPIRYVKEDSADNTVRTSACNLNFNYIPIEPLPEVYRLEVDELTGLVEQRLDNQLIEDKFYRPDLSLMSDARMEVPFAIAFETAHFGDDIGIVSGSENREEIMPLIKAALECPYEEESYQQAAQFYREATARTFERAAELESSLLDWNKQEQYEGHAQLIFRLRDQHGNGVEHFDIMLKSVDETGELSKLEKMIEDHHGNKCDKGTITFYFRTEKFIEDSKTWENRLDNIAPINVEITGHEPLSEDIVYVPIDLKLSQEEIKKVVESFKTTIIDITLVRLPSDHVFEVKSV